MPGFPSIQDCEAILFDVDGTLYHPKRLRLAIMRRILKRNWVNPSRTWRIFRILRAYRQAQEELRHALLAQLALPADQYGLAAKMLHIPEEMVADCVNRWFDQEPLSLLAAFVRPGLQDFLTAARHRGLRLGIVSDYPAEQKLDALGIRSYFDVVVTAQDPQVQRFKPNPTGLLAAARRLHVAPERALYIGDRRSIDEKAATAAGMPHILIGSRGNGYDTVRSFGELMHVCGF